MSAFLFISSLSFNIWEVRLCLIVRELISETLVICLGIIIVFKFLIFSLKFICALIIISSSPLWVLAAHQTLKSFSISLLDSFILSNLTFEQNFKFPM